MIQALDDILNRYTMYRVVIYGLSVFLAGALILGSSGVITVSARDLCLSIIVLVISCYVVNKLLSSLLRLSSSNESWLISALILACILPPATVSTVGYIALTGLLAMASKYILTYRGSHIFNPAAFGAFVVSITGILPATWWIATPWMTPLTILLALVVLRKLRRFQLFFAFALSAVAMLLLTGSILQGHSVESVLHNAVVSWPIIFFGSIMLTEPSTLPPIRYYQLWLGIIIGLAFTSQLHVGRLATTPQAVLLFGNILTALASPTYGAMLKLKAIRPLSSNIFELVFARPAQFAFTAGQYVELTLPHKHTDSRGNRRTFSLASPPHEPAIRITLKSYNPGSSFKKALLQLKPNDRIRAAHVAGNFMLPHNPQHPLLFIAGGIGITPFHSMIGALQDKRDITLLYFANSEQEFIYEDDFQQAEARGVHTHYLLGRLTAENLQELAPDFSERTIYLSGPDPMVRSYVRLLTDLGVSRRHIRTDYFTGY